MKITELLQEYDITSYRKGDERDPRSPHYVEPPDGEQSTEQVTFPWDVYDAAGQEVIATGTVTADVTGGPDEKGRMQVSDISMLSFMADSGRTYDYHNALATFGRQAFDTRDMVDSALEAVTNLSPRYKLTAFLI